MKHLKQHEADNSICPNCGKKNNTEVTEEYWNKDYKGLDIYHTVGHCQDCNFTWVDFYGYSGTKIA